MRQRTFVIILVAASAAHWAILYFQIPVVHRLAMWFWRFRDTPLVSLWPLIPIITLAGLAFLSAFKCSGRIFQNLALLVLLGYSMQLGLAALEGRGIDGVRDRLVTTGHAELAKIASKGWSPAFIASHYEEILQRQQFERAEYIQTKPPGTLLFFALSENIANSLFPASSEQDRYETLVTFAAYVFPLLASLAVIPLFLLSRAFLSGTAAIIPSLLYLFVPSVALMTLHLDQVLFPSLFASCVWLSIYAAERESLAFALAAGILTYASLYFSFSLLPLVIACLIMIIGLTWMSVEPGSPRKLALKLRLVLGYLGGLLLLYIAFRLLLHYDPVLRFVRAMDMHQLTKLWRPGFKNFILVGFVNAIEYILWAGIPITLLFFSDIASVAKNLSQKLLNDSDLVPLVVLLVLVGLEFFGKTKAEAARLWLYLMPLVCLSGARVLEKRFSGRLQSGLLIILALQFVTILLTKRFQDFW